MKPRCRHELVVDDICVACCEIVHRYWCGKDHLGHCDCGVAARQESYIVSRPHQDDLRSDQTLPGIGPAAIFRS